MSDRSTSRPPNRASTIRETSRPSTPSHRLLRTSSTLSITSSVSSLFGSPALSTSTSTSASDTETRGLITSAFVPNIAVHVSSDVDDLAREKGFKGGFAELLRPYGEELQGRINVRDSQGLSASHDDFGVRFVELGEMAKAGERWETGMSRGMNGNQNLNPTSATTTEEKEKVFVGGVVDEVEELLGLQLLRKEEGREGERDTEEGRGPYWRFLRSMLSALPVVPHETFSYPVACVIAISSRNQHPIETLRNLYTSGTQVPLPSYVQGEYLRYYVLVHDEDRDDINRSTLLFNNMQKHFGLHCHLLRLRSSGKTAPTDDDAIPFPSARWISAAESLTHLHALDTSDLDPTLYLPESDDAGLRTLAREMVQSSIVPFMERCIATWNDQVASRRKGLSGRFLSLSKRYFSSSASSSPSSTPRNSLGGGSGSSNYDPVSGSYPPSSPEAQMRLLADYAFMLRDYKLAHSIYDLLRTDYSNDKAWTHHAAAHEMTVLSLLLLPTPITTKTRADTITPYLDLAVYSYVNRCSALFPALRCLLVAVELLRARGGGAVDDAARWAVRALDLGVLGKVGEAVVTERVGDVYASRKGAGPTGIGGRGRKAAMWRMLAAREWVQAGRAAEARRCLDMALPVYGGVAGVWEEVEGFVRGLVEAAGYGVGEGDAEDGEVETEALEMGMKRMSVISPPVGKVAGVDVDEGEEKKRDDFVQS